MVAAAVAVYKNGGMGTGDCPKRSFLPYTIRYIINYIHSGKHISQNRWSQDRLRLRMSKVYGGCVSFGTNNTSLS